MQPLTRIRLIRALTWGVIVPLAILLVVANTLVWTTNPGWAAEVSSRTLPIVIMGFGVIFLVQSLKDQRAISSTRSLRARRRLHI